MFFIFLKLNFFSGLQVDISSLLLVSSKVRSFCCVLIWILKKSHMFGDLWSVGLDYADPKKNNNYMGKIVLAMTLTAMCIILLKQSPTFNTTSVVLLLIMLLY